MKETLLCKQILQGDTLVLVARSNLTSERRVRIAGIACPRLGLKTATSETKDEPYAFEAREFTRTHTIGKDLQVTIIPNKGKLESAQIAVDGKDLAALLVEAGLANVLPGSKLSNVAHLEELRVRARQNGKGIHNTSPPPSAVRTVKYATGDVNFVRGVVEEHLHEEIEGIIEYVRDGSHLTVYFPSESLQVQISVTGISCPGFRGGQAEPLAEEAKQFVEFRLLNRSIPFVIDGHDNYGTMWATPKHPRGSVPELLLSEGLAQINDMSIKCLSKSSEELVNYRAAQKAAQLVSKGVWKNKPVSTTIVAAPAEPRETIDMGDAAAYDKMYPARVMDVSSGDSLMVVNLSRLTSQSAPAMSDVASNERRIYLSSIRAPRPRTRARDGEPWWQDAINLVKQMVAGKRVKIVVDYVRTPQPSATGGELPPASDDYGRLHFCTVFVSERESVNAELVRRGYARVQRHRQNEDKSAIYDELNDLEEEAKAAKRGLHSPDEPPKYRVNDLVGPENTQKARSLEASLRRTAKFQGQVDHVFNAARYVISIPSEHCRLTFLLAGVRAPQMGRVTAEHATEAQPFAEEATAWARWHLLHRKVQIELLQCDRGGNFIGHLHMAGATLNATSSLNYKCLAEGCGRTDGMTRLSRYAESLFEAEKKAVSQRIGMWALPDLVNDYKEAAHLQPDIDDDAKTTDATPPRIETVVEAFSERFHQQRVFVCFAESVDSFYVQLEDDAELSKIMELCDDAGKLVASEDVPSPDKYTMSRPPKVGDIVLAQFSKDDVWYRARVVGSSGVNLKIQYLDFGNTESVSVTRLARLPPALNLISRPPQCLNVKLAGVKTVREFAKSATDALEETCGDNVLRLDVSSDKSMTASPTSVYLTLCQTTSATAGGGSAGAPSKAAWAAASVLSSGSAKTVNEVLMEKGLVKLAVGGGVAGDIMRRLRVAEQSARQRRLGMWYYGDIGDSDDEDDMPQLRR